MIDARTLLILLAVAELAFAVALWMGASRALRDGLSQWAASLVLRALGLALLLGSEPAAGGLSVGMALLAVSLTLQAAALCAYDQRSLPAWVHSAAVAVVAIPFQLLVQDPATAMLFGGLVFGMLFFALAVLAWRMQAPAGTRARGVLVGACLVAGAVFSVRGVGAVFVSFPLAGVVAPTGLAASSMLAVFAAAIASTLAFLMLHKERSDDDAERHARTDPLTGAYNRVAFHEMAERELSRASAAWQPLSMIMLDIDGFREVNQSHGHRAGDAVLRRFAEVIHVGLRKQDMLVRFGGDKFLVVLPDVPGPGAVVVAGRLRRALEAEPLLVDGESFALTASLGVAARLDEGPESIDELVARAEAALQLAKRRGRNRVVALSLGRSIAA